MQKDLKTFIAPFRRHDDDNGSPEVQIALLSYEIKELQDHLSEHKKDIDAKRSLLKKVARRRKLLKYLKESEAEKYAFVTKKLKLKTQ